MPIAPRPGAPPLPRPGTVTVIPGKPSPSDAIAGQGGALDRFSDVRRALFEAAAEASAPQTPRTPGAASDRPPNAALVKPSKAQVRAAHAQAVMGVRLGGQGRQAEAIAALRRSVELDPTVATVHHDLGLAWLAASRFEEAAGAFADAVRLKPELASAHHNLAISLDHLGRAEYAFLAYEAAVKLEPGRDMAQFRLGQIHLGRGRQAQAAAAFRAAAAAIPGTTQARINEAFAAEAEGDTAAAQAILRAVLAEDPDCGLAHLVLGHTLGQEGKAAEAAAHLERGISLVPDMIGSWQGFAANTKFTAADHAVIDRIRACLERPALTPVQRKAVHFALGKALDDIGEHGEAMTNFDAANRIRAAGAVLDRVSLARQSRVLIEATPKGYLDRTPDLGVADETPILIVGMPRSGTTLVEQILSSHPDVAPGGELGFWLERNRAGTRVYGATAKPEEVRALANDYLAVLREIAPGAARVTDKMPFNFGLLGLIRQVFPRATIVHCRRHPVDTCLSIFTTSFETTIDFAGERGSLVFFYRQYQKLMAHWREVLPPDRFIEVDYEALVADPEPLTRRLIAACGLEWNDACLAPQRNQRRITTASLWQARQPIYRTSVARWRRYEPWLGELRQLLTPEEAAES